MIKVKYAFIALALATAACSPPGSETTQSEGAASPVLGEVAAAASAAAPVSLLRAGNSVPAVTSTRLPARCRMAMRLKSIWCSRTERGRYSRSSAISSGRPCRRWSAPRLPPRRVHSSRSASSKARRLLTARLSMNCSGQLRVEAPPEDRTWKCVGMREVRR